MYGVEKNFSVSSGRAGDGGDLGDDVRLDEGVDRQRDVAGRYFRVPLRAGVCLYLVHFAEKAVRRFMAGRVLAGGCRVLRRGAVFRD